jgi:hypothetical protein
MSCLYKYICRGDMYFQPPQMLLFLVAALDPATSLQMDFLEVARWI